VQGCKTHIRATEECTRAAVEKRKGLREKNTTKLPQFIVVWLLSLTGKGSVQKNDTKGEAVGVREGRSRWASFKVRGGGGRGTLLGKGGERGTGSQREGGSRAEVGRIVGVELKCLLG